MAGLYVHISFCARACTGRDFHFTTRVGPASDGRSADRANCETNPAWSGHTFRTLYFGAGPSAY